MASADGRPRPDSVVAFAQDLRRRRGELSVRQLAERAELAPSTISAATTGKKLPALTVTLAYVRACPPLEQVGLVLSAYNMPEEVLSAPFGIEHQQWVLRWGYLNSLATPGPSAAPRERTAPRWLGEPVGSYAELVGVLQRLRRWADLSYRQLSADTGITKTMLWQHLTAATTLRLSDRDILAIVRSCLETELTQIAAAEQAEQFVLIHCGHVPESDDHGKLKPADTHNLSELVDALRTLGSRSGRSYRDLERQGGPATSTAYRVFNGGQNLATMHRPHQFIHAYLQALGIESRPWLNHFDHLLATARSGAAPTTATADSTAVPKQDSDDTALDHAQILTSEEFGQALQVLIDRTTGRTPLRVLASRGHVSAQTIMRWFSGRAVPTRRSQAFPEFLRSLGLPDEDIREWVETASRVGTIRTKSGRAPYLGLNAFQADDADVYLGREELIDQLHTSVVAALERTGPRTIVLVGPSGAGKTSLIHAGLLPALPHDVHQTHLFTPGSDELLPYLQTSSDHSGPQVVVIDQLEELWSLERGPGAEKLFSVLEDLDEAGPVIVAVLRADYFGHALGHPFLVRAINDGLITMEPMTTQQLTDVIVGPARAVGVTVDPDLTEVLLSELGAHNDPDEGVLPLLSHALTQTWNARRPGRDTLTVEDYHRAGRIGPSIDATAEAVYNGLDHRSKQLARRIFLQGIELSTYGLTRRVVTDSELRRATIPIEQIYAVIDQFVAARLITADAGTYQISNATILHDWTRLKTWLDEERDHFDARHDLATVTRDWVNHGRTEDWFVTRGRLQRLLATAENAANMITDAEAEFILANVGQHPMRQRRRWWPKLPKAPWPPQEPIPPRSPPGSTAGNTS